MSTFYAINLLPVYRADIISKVLKLRDIQGYNSIPIGWKLYGDHCTVYFGKEDEIPESIQKFIKRYLNHSLRLSVTAIGESDKAIAVKVELEGFIDVFSINKNPHITIAIHPEAAPVMSNEIKNWMDISDYKIYLRGILQKIH